MNQCAFVAGFSEPSRGVMVLLLLLCARWILQDYNVSEHFILSKNRMGGYKSGNVNIPKWKQNHLRKQWVYEILYKTFQMMKCKSQLVFRCKLRSSFSLLQPNFSCCTCFDMHSIILLLMPQLIFWLSVTLDVSCRWRSAEWSVLVVVPGCGGHLLLGPLHLRLPHAGVPLLQEGQNWLQGGQIATSHQLPPETLKKTTWGMKTNWNTHTHIKSYEVLMKSGMEMCTRPAFARERCC